MSDYSLVRSACGVKPCNLKALRLVMLQTAARHSMQQSQSLIAQSLSFMSLETAYLRIPMHNYARLAQGVPYSSVLSVVTMLMKMFMTSALVSALALLVTKASDAPTHLANSFKAKSTYASSPLNKQTHNLYLSQIIDNMYFVLDISKSQTQQHERHPCKNIHLFFISQHPIICTKVSY